MDCLLDTNILVRLADTISRDHRLTLRALATLNRQGHRLCLTPQNYVEFHGVATRPRAANGLGLTLEEAVKQAEKFEQRFGLLEDLPSIYPAWKALTRVAGIIGKQVHDARLVAVCQVHGVNRILSFNVGDLARPAQLVPEMVLLHPADVVAATMP